MYHILNEKRYIYSFLQCIDAFVDELRWEEQDSTKRDKIHELKLTTEEWVQVGTFLDLLSVCYSFIYNYIKYWHFLLACW